MEQFISSGLQTPQYFTIKFWSQIFIIFQQACNYLQINII